MSKETQIIALGDGGLDTEDPMMDLYILAQSKKKEPKVCLIPTASGDNPGLINLFRKLYSRYPCKTSFLTLFSPHINDIEDFIMSQDIIFVSGGHSRNMMVLWKSWGVDKFLFNAYNNGTILAGGSAGSVCWFDECITDSIPGALSVMKCLGFLPYSNCPHFSSKTRRSAYRHFIERKEIKPGYAIDDYAGAHFVNGSLFRSVSSRPYAKTYNVSIKEDNSFSQKRLKTKWLGYKEYQDDLIFKSPTFSSDEEIVEDTKSSELRQG